MYIKHHANYYSAHLGLVGNKEKKKGKKHNPIRIRIVYYDDWISTPLFDFVVLDDWLIGSRLGIFI